MEEQDKWLSKAFCVADASELGHDLVTQIQLLLLTSYICEVLVMLKNLEDLKSHVTAILE